LVRVGTQAHVGGKRAHAGVDLLVGKERPTMKKTSGERKLGGV